MPGRMRRRAVALTVFVVVASACSQPGTSGSGGALPTSSSPGGVPKLLDFTAPLLEGGTLRGSDYAGEDVAIWFWAPW